MIVTGVLVAVAVFEMWADVHAPPSSLPVAASMPCRRLRGPALKEAYVLVGGRGTQTSPRSSVADAADAPVTYTVCLFVCL